MFKINEDSKSFLNKYINTINKSYNGKNSKNKSQDSDVKDEVATETYIKPQFKPLTQEQIDDIHSRGKITPEEKVKEWNDMDLCAPGDAIGSASWRCEKFKNCQDCLIDYANQYDEYISFYDVLKNYKPNLDNLLKSSFMEDDSTEERRG